LRIYKNKKLNNIIKIINKRLNAVYHTTIKNIPLKVMNQKLTIINANNNVKDKIINDEKRFNYRYVRGMKVYVKNFNAHKLDNLFLGPVEVKEVAKNKRWLKLKGVNGWVHVNNIKAY
ncbi:hypothetical protein H311_01695, partial [Anncaliia algerae PRA109]